MDKSTNKSPIISVVMSCYGEPLEWIGEAINSILNQTFSDFEFIIINDKPNREELKEYLKKYQEKDYRIKIISNPENFGLTKSLNIGLKLASGKYIARMDADDISLPTRFEKQVDYLEKHPKVGIVGCWLKDIGSKQATRKIPVSDDMIKLRWIIRPPFDHPATIMRTSTLRDNNITYNENLKYAQDMQLWYEMKSHCEFANIPEILFLHRHNDQQVSNLHSEEQLANTKMVRRKLLDDLRLSLNLIDSVPNNITLEYIKDVKRKISENQYNYNIGTCNYFIYYLYLSLSNYNYKTLLSFLFDSVKYGKYLTCRDYLRVIAKNLFQKKYKNSGV